MSDPLPYEATVFADGERTQTTDFDWRELEERLGEFPESERVIAGDCLAVLFTWINQAPSLKGRLTRFAALMSGIRPDEYGTLAKLANELGCGRAAVSRMSKMAERALGLRFARSKPATACERMAKRRTGGPSRRSKAKVSVETADSNGDAPEASQAPAIGLPTAPLTGPFPPGEKRVVTASAAPF